MNETTHHVPARPELSPSSSGKIVPLFNDDSYNGAANDGVPKISPIPSDDEYPSADYLFPIHTKCLLRRKSWNQPLLVSVSRPNTQRTRHGKIQVYEGCHKLTIASDESSWHTHGKIIWVMKGDSSLQKCDDNFDISGFLITNRMAQSPDLECVGDSGGINSDGKRDRTEEDGPENLKSIPKSENKKSKKASRNGDTDETKIRDSPHATSAISTPSKSPVTAKSPGSAKKPTYIVMIHEAIKTLGDRSGSSVPAIQKWILHHYPPANVINVRAMTSFKHSFSMGLKTGIKAGRFTKIKNSYKLNVDWVKKEKAQVRAKENARKIKEKMRKKKIEEERAKRKKDEQAKKEGEKKKKDEERLKKEIEEKARKMAEKEKENVVTKEELAKIEAKKIAEEERKEKIRIRAERIRKRKFPMDDLRLIEEDKELTVRNVLPRRPQLSHAFGGLLSKTLVSDAMEVFWCFSGAMSGRLNYYAPDFSLDMLAHSLHEIASGNSRKSRSLPPLIVHLFTAALRFLTQGYSKNAELSEEEKQIKKDLENLNQAISPISWPEVIYHYFDVMEQYYISQPGDEMDFNENGHGDVHSGYLGPTDGPLAKVWIKLGSKDCWFLSVDEVLILLKSLCNDMLGELTVCEDIGAKHVELYEFLKAKKSADSNYRKTKLLFEGKSLKPKKKMVEENDHKEGEKK